MIFILESLNLLILFINSFDSLNFDFGAQINFNIFSHDFFQGALMVSAPLPLQVFWRLQNCSVQPVSVYRVYLGLRKIPTHLQFMLESIYNGSNSLCFFSGKKIEGRKTPDFCSPFFVLPQGRPRVRVDPTAPHQRRRGNP